MSNSLKAFLFVIGDAAMLYAALFITLLIRYGGAFYEQFKDAHALPFTIVFIVWIAVFYVAGLYDLRRLRNNIDFLKTLFLSLVTNAVLAVVIFYLVPAFGIAPKTNLFIFILVFAVIEVVWRRLLNRLTEGGAAPNRVLFVGNGTLGVELKKVLREAPQLGYEIRGEIDEAAAAASPGLVREIVERENANLVIIPHQLKNEPALVAVLYKLFGMGVFVTDLGAFYELIMRKVPVAELGETWFLENIEGGGKFYDPLKRAWELAAALVIGIVLLPVEIVIAVLVAITSRGPIIYQHKRVGANGKEFDFYKFRNMRADAEKGGAQWAIPNDPRTTPIGNFLRKSHLDELPQLWNIIRGDMSFVGPRPERPEFVEKLKRDVPFYEVRLLLKPGVTGWAQLHHRADLGVEDVKQKLQYDVYYLKNRSLALDLAIILKTLKSLFVNPQ